MEEMNTISEVGSIGDSNNVPKTNVTDMCQKKVLWILLAAGIFLLTVIGAALMLYSPSKKDENNSSLYISKDFEKKEDMAEAKNVPFVLDTQNTQTDLQSGLLQNINMQQTDALASSITSSVDKTNEKDNTSENAPIQTQDLTVYAQNTNVYQAGTVIDLDTLKSTPLKSTPSTSIEEKNMNAQKQYSKQDLQVETKPQTQTKKVVASSQKKVTPKPPAKSQSQKTAVQTQTKVQTKLPDSFWVQAASYSSKKGADNALSVLQVNNIQADIFTYQNDSKLFYRVRVGPFTTKSEAEYWLAKVCQIKEFEQTKCYVTNAAKKK